MTRTDQRRAFDSEVRAAAKVLRYDWDPIGLRQMSFLPADEYDSYALRVVSMINHGSSDEAIATYLEELEQRTIAVSSGLDLLVVAARLRAAVAAASKPAT